MKKYVRLFFQNTRRPIVFNRVSTKPISNDFGLSRGTPIDRYYIESFLRENALDVKGAALEIAESTYTRQFNHGITSFEILHVDRSNRKATIIGDLTQPETLPDKTVDCFICTQTLNFIFDVRKAIEGCFKLLKDGGVFLGTVSGISQISRYDMNRWGDYWRFTDLSLKKLFAEYFREENITIQMYGNVFAANAFLQGLALEDIEDKSLLNVRDIDYQVTLGIRAVR
jgi:putative methyltransferase